MTSLLAAVLDPAQQHQAGQWLTILAGFVTLYAKAHGESRAHKVHADNCERRLEAIEKRQIQLLEDMGRFVRMREGPDDGPSNVRSRPRRTK
jgi:hypothetical protein